MGINGKASRSEEINMSRITLLHVLFFLMTFLGHEVSGRSQDFIDDNDVEDNFDEEECQLKLFHGDYFTGVEKVVEAIELNAYEKLTRGNKIKSFRSVGDCCWLIRKAKNRRLRTVYTIDSDNKEME